ncbi:MAG: DUF2161 family putative PD-(D/E)XK-type phosphodiesterase [Bacillota bacterium]
MNIKETDLYPPVHDYLVSCGYTVRSEVRDVDITAVKGDQLVVLELKRAFSVDLLIQAVKRQKLADSVYVVLPYPRRGTQNRRWSDFCHLLRRLHLGLMLVSLGPPRPRVEVAFHPLPFQPQRRSGQRRAVLEEIRGRLADLNQAGSTRTKIVTAYREQAVQIARHLQDRGPQSPRQLRAMGTGPKTLSILSKNYYGWFERVQPGVYTLSGRGTAELELYRDLPRRHQPAGDGQESAGPARGSA